MTDKVRNPVFDYRALRLLVGIIAFAIAPVVTIIAAKPLASVSASYYTDAHDAFVGMLFVVGAFMWAYNGHSPKQAAASKVASVAAICVALFPTSCPTCETGPTAVVHTVAAIGLFLILAYFCFGPFREKTKGQGGKKRRRSGIYFACGSVMVVAMLAGLIAKITMDKDVINDLGIIYWVEAVALGAFGIAWIVAGKSLGFLVDDEQKLKIFK